jgi:hypothetical protein
MITKLKQKTEQINFYFHHIIRGEKFKVCYALEIDLESTEAQVLNPVIYDLQPVHSDCSILTLLQDSTNVMKELNELVANRVNEDYTIRKKLFVEAKAHKYTDGYSLFQVKHFGKSYAPVEDLFENFSSIDIAEARINEHFEKQLEQKFAQHF